MTINRRDEQSVTTSSTGIQVRTLTDESTGSKMLTVLDITIGSGGNIPYRVNVSHEETYFIASGDVRFKLGGSSFSLTSGDCVLVKKGDACGVENIGASVARVITVCPDSNPSRSDVDEPEMLEGVPGANVMVRASVEPFEFAPGVWRVDMVGDFRGASSTYLSELSFDAGARTPNHYHPAHEESMFCYEGELSAVYGDDDAIPLFSGDMFLCEPTVRHTVNNLSGRPGVLLAIHPVLNPPPRVLCD